MQVTGDRYASHFYSLPAREGIPCAAPGALGDGRCPGISGRRVRRSNLLRCDDQRQFVRLQRRCLPRLECLRPGRCEHQIQRRPVDTGDERGVCRGIPAMFAGKQPRGKRMSGGAASVVVRGRPRRRVREALAGQISPGSAAYATGGGLRYRQGFQVKAPTLRAVRFKQFRNAVPTSTGAQGMRAAFC